MASTSIRTASPTKLQTGAWGAKVAGAVEVGEIVEIRTAAGKTWQARVERVVWAGGGVSIVATASMDRSAAAPRYTPTASRSSARGTWTGCRCGSVEEYAKASDCRDCRHDRD